MTLETIDLDPGSKRSLKVSFFDWLNKIQFGVYTLLVLCLLAVGFLWHRMFIVVPPGHLGVMYRSVYGGTVTNRIWGEGLTVIPPWDKLTLYDVRLQQKTLDFKVLSDEGLNLGVEVVVRYRPYEEMLGYLQKDIGPDYFDSLIRPEIEAHIRRTFGGRPAHEVYASARDVLQEVGQFPLIGRLDRSEKGVQDSRPYVHVQELKLTQIELPQVVEEANVEKYRQEQLMLAYKYKLDREVKEADRKRTEAAGIRDFNLIAGKVSPDMLRWRSIDATLELAKSNNSKVVVLGGAQGNMALQLNLADTPSGPPVMDPAAPQDSLRPDKKLAQKPSPADPATYKPDDERAKDRPEGADNGAPNTKTAVVKSAAAGVAAAAVTKAVTAVKETARKKPAHPQDKEQPVQSPERPASRSEGADNGTPAGGPRTVAERYPNFDRLPHPKAQ